jgi:predicted ATP-dependent endonuclease of OLD family
MEPDRYLRRVRSRVVIDDGTPTDLEFKGDGVQSLAALSLIRHYSQEGAPGRELILAVEEPESHLHPRAIHEVAGVLRDTARTQQVVVSTHSPLLVNRFALASNIIVEKARARSAASVAELRDVLGVRTSDNLENAEVVLVVEGSSDKAPVTAILADRSMPLARALEAGALAVQPLFGGAKLTYVLSLLQNSMCRVHTFLDDDQEGQAAARRSREEGLLVPADETFARFPGAQESEIEDLYEPAAYHDSLWNEFGVDSARFAAIPRNRGKWSTRMRLTFINDGRNWDDGVQSAVKECVGAAVAANPRQGIIAQCAPLLEALAVALEAKLDEANQ